MLTPNIPSTAYFLYHNDSTLTRQELKQWDLSFMSCDVTCYIVHVVYAVYSTRWPRIVHFKQHFMYDGIKLILHCYNLCSVDTMCIFI
uniref:Uncharacterized protein n=1 Tax=Pararge aegeria TaxID=116150 RepID=S4PUU7_9NEOP